jgi:hypothetical protein
VSELERKKLLVGLEADFRSAETALAIAQADFERAYAALWTYMNANTEGHEHQVLAFGPDVTMH